MKKTVLAVLVATATASGAAQASNVDVDNVINTVGAGTSNISAPVTPTQAELKARFAELKHQQFEGKSREAQNRMRVEAQGQHVDYNAVVVAAHDAQAQIVKSNIEAARIKAADTAKGEALTQDNIDRTASQNGALANAREASRIQPQIDAKERVVGLAKKIDNVNRNHDQLVALMQAQEVSRTASQRVNVDQAAADARLNSMKPVVDQAAADSRLNSMKPVIGEDAAVSRLNSMSVDP
ncbi:hypothetical protein FFB58_22385, partial [Enterobacter sp. MF024]|uniref:hypothetical protein n=1 Tax=Enterobacter sp. MF024 TaxID=2555644 RepID=UPI0011064623